jgi:hypothetical protein
MRQSFKEAVTCGRARRGDTGLTGPWGHMRIATRPRGHQSQRFLMLNSWIVLQPPMLACCVASRVETSCFSIAKKHMDQGVATVAVTATPPPHTTLTSHATPGSAKLPDRGCFKNGKLSLKIISGIQGSQPLSSHDFSRATFAFLLAE